MVGKVKRTEVCVRGAYYNFDERFEEAMGWIDHTVDVLAINVLSRSEDGLNVVYEVIYRSID